jgi:hypothetical protein
MKNKNFLILIAVLVALVLIYVIQQFATGRKTLSETELTIYPGLDSAAVKYVKVFKRDYPDSGVVFARQDTGWIVSSHFDAPAKNSEVWKLISDIKALTGEVRSSSPELLADYDLTDSLALNIILLGSDSSPMAHMMVGKGLTGAGRSSFIRKNGDNTVYKANENFLSRFSMWDSKPYTKIPLNRVMDLKMANIAVDSMKSLQLVAKGKNYLFERQQQSAGDSTTPPQYAWQQKEPAKGKSLEDRDIAGIASRLCSLSGSDLLRSDNPAAFGLDKPQYQANIIFNGGSKTSFVFGAMADTISKMHYTVVDSKPFIYKVNDAVVQGLFENPFKPKEPPKDKPKK